MSFTRGNKSKPESEEKPAADESHQHKAENATYDFNGAKK